MLVIFSRTIVGASLALAFSFPAWAGDLPDPVLTPGAMNPDVTQDNILKTICVPGYTKTIRPTASYTNNIKRQQLDTNYKGQGEMNTVEEDHLIPLIAGGLSLIHISEPTRLGMIS